MALMSLSRLLDRFAGGRIARCLVGLSLTLAGTLAAAQAPLLLDRHVPTVDTWPALRVLADPTQELTLDGAQKRLDEFAVPAVPYGNFGVRREALWLHAPVRRLGGSAEWVLELDYAPLNRIDVYLVGASGVLRHAVLGNALAAEQRPMRSRGHAVTLELPRDVPLQLYVRVQTTSSMIVPMRLYAQDAFVAQESSRQMLQGLLFGISLALLFYSLANGVSLRDPLYAQYAVMLIGVTTFFLSYTGIGHQYLWSQQTGLLGKIAPLGVLLAMVGGSLFAGNAMRVQVRHPWTHRGLQAVAAVAGTTIVLSVLGLLDYRPTQLIASLIGPIPVVLALRVALAQARAGDRVAVLMVIGWGAYTLGAISIALLLRGAIDADFAGQHLFQFCSLVEMFAWVRVLGMRVEDVRRDAERAQLEKDALHSLAHTDPLTGLPNRRGLGVALQAALPKARVDSAVAVFLLDLDGFKPVNDRLGHDAGDELLKQVGQRLRGLLRSADVVARLGGDEFVVMSAGIASEGDAQHLGRKMLDAFREPFMVAGQECRVGLTIGFALSPHDGYEAGDLLKRADAAMYAGKQAGRHQLRRGAASPGLVGI